MTANSSPALARLAALGVFVALPALFLTFAVANLVSTNEIRRQITRQESTLHELAARLPALDRGEAASSLSLYLLGSTPSLAAADLRRRVTAAVIAAGGRLIETRFVDADRPETSADLLSLGATFDIGNAGLARLLQNVETGLPVIRVRTLSLRRADSRPTTTDEDPLLRADLVFEASRRSDGS